MVNRWEKQFGSVKAEQICIANNQPPEVNLSLNPKFDRDDVVTKLKALGYQMNLIESNPETWVVHNPEGLFEEVLFEKGAFIVQNAASSKLMEILARNEGALNTVFDAFSAPGGKVIQLEWLVGEGINLIVAGEKSISRSKRLQENLRRVHSAAHILIGDALHPSFNHAFDLVIADVPCSATGNIKKYPEIKWTRSETDFIENGTKQLQFLNQLKDFVLPGGRLAYMTCSMEDEENKKVIERFVSGSKGQFIIEPYAIDDETEGMITPEGYYFCQPDPYRTGVFSSQLRRVK